MNEFISQLLMVKLLRPMSDALMPIMFLAFAVGVGTRLLLWYTVRSEFRFAKEFEKRMVKYLTDSRVERVPNFFKITRVLLEKTYFESFELRKKYQRRNFDHVATVADRIFLIQDGAQRLVKDTLKHARYLRKDGPEPRMLDITKGVFDLNPVFTRLLGIIPVNLASEMLNILPGLFVVGGIFGTFLGVSAGLPQLGGMDLSNIEQSKQVMDKFLVDIAYAMATSILGIILSVAMTMLNTAFAADGLYFNLINTYAGVLETLWNETTENVADRDDYGHDEVRGRGDRSRPRSPQQMKKPERPAEDPTRTLTNGGEDATRVVTPPSKPKGDGETGGGAAA